MSETAPVYLDYNATALPLPAAREAMDLARRDAWGNPASVHAVGRTARAWLEDARERIALALQVPARAVIFVSGGTEANNWALREANTLVTSRLEHPSVTRVAEELERRGGTVSWLPVATEGTVLLSELERVLATTPPGATLALMAANHETGVLQPIAAAAELCRRHGARLHVDAVQFLGKAPAADLGVGDTLSIAAHKLGGPKGIGALVFRGRAPAHCLVGGAQERGLRPGTQDAVLAAGFAAAVEHAVTALPTRGRLEALRDQLERTLASVSVRNGDAARLPHVSNLSFPGRSGPELVAALDLLGVCVSSGSACSAGTLEPSLGIAAMAGPERARSAVRFSLGEATTRSDVERAASAVLSVLGR